MYLRTLFHEAVAHRSIVGAAGVFVRSPHDGTRHGSSGTPRHCVCSVIVTIRGEATLRPVHTTLADSSATAKRNVVLAAEGWSQRVGGYSALPSLIRLFDVDPAVVLHVAGLASDALDDAEARIPYAGLGRLLLAAANRSGCAHLGVLAGRMLRLSDLGPLGDVVRNCATVGEALHAFVAHQHRDSEGALTFLVDVGATIELGYAIYHPYVCGTDHLYDAALAAMINYLRELCGNGWMPTEVLVPHARPVDVPPYRVLLRANPRFNANVCAIRFSAKCMTLPIALVEAPAHPATFEAEPMRDVLQEAFRALRRLLLEGRISGDGVASALGMHRRTLNRRLKARGTTFQCILDEVRFGLARELLSASDLGLDDVAANLGYSGISPFSRTFQRWAGTAPGRWRRVQLAGATAGPAD
jgi:AraC-like DNA-binding protein